MYKLSQYSHIIKFDLLMLLSLSLSLSLSMLQVKGGVMKDWRKELETQERIVRMQRELERAKEDLWKIRKERAKH